MGWKGGNGTYGVVDVRANNKTLGAAVLAVLQRNDVTRLCGR
jgi:hypothetical protein